MPDVWTPDDLRFALAAYLEPPRQVAGDLLAAVGQPATRLDDVTAFQARLRAAEVLLRAGERTEAMTVLRRAVQEAGRHADPRTQVAAAAVCAEAGDPAEAEALVMQALRARPAVYTLIGGLIKASLGLAGRGHFEQAIRIADETIASTSGLSGHGYRGALNTRIADLAGLAKEEILAIRQECLAAGADPADRQARRQGSDQHAEELAEGASSQPPWPALAGSCLLWWPCAEYGRVVRQVPGLRDVLGATWREHTARVESAMAAAMAAEAAPAGSGDARLSLAAADYEEFARYLERTGADPRLAQVMTAFTGHAGAGHQRAARWPPGRRDPCWCGSKKRYRRCCAA
jgi:tetratricopeptide (TPR) repeat protein